MSRDRFLEKPTKPEPDLSENYKMFSNRFLQKLKPTKLLSFDRAPYCKLALDRTSISDIEMRKVISYLKMHPEITDVDLMFTKVSNKALAALISEVRPLHDIDAFNPGYSLGKENKEDLDILAQVIEKSEHLAELSLPSMDAVGLSVMTNSLKKNQTIQSISLSISHQDEKKQIQAAAAISNLLESKTQLKELFFHSHNIEMSDHVLGQIAKGLRNNNTLEKLSFYDLDKISDQNIEALAEAIEARGKPISLSLYYKPMISEKGIQILLSCKNIIAFEPDDLYKSLAEQAKLNREAHGIPSGIPIREQIEMAYAMCRRNP